MCCVIWLLTTPLPPKQTHQKCPDVLENIKYLFLESVWLEEDIILKWDGDWDLKTLHSFAWHSKICFLISIDPLTIFDVIIILDDENFPQNFTPASLLFSRATLATSENKDACSKTWFNYPFSRNNKTFDCNHNIILEGEKLTKLTLTSRHS